MWLKPDETMVRRVHSVFFFNRGIYFRFQSDSSQEFGKMIEEVFVLFVFISFRTTDQANPYFLLQRRRSHDERRSGLASFFAAKIDSVLENKVISN